MRIVIDARLWAEAGIGRYIRNLVRELENIDQKNQYFLLLLKSQIDILTFQSNFQKVKADFGWYGLKEQRQIPQLLTRLKPDLVHFPHFNVPVFYHGKFVVTIHDLIHQHFKTKRATTKDFFTYRFKTLGYNLVFKHAVSGSKKIIVPSWFVKEQLEKEWQVPGKKIVITPEGVEESLLKIAKKNLSSFGYYLYYVGNAHPHKNIEGLIKVFSRIKQEHPEVNLVLSGPDNYFWQRIRREKALDGIIFTGFVSEEEMVSLYKNALCFVTPSKEEGFGIPILEAMALGCPVVSSKAGSLPEVGGKAALYFDPLNQEEMYQQITRVINDPLLRQELIEKGKKQAEEFSWKKMAQQTLEVYRCV